MATYRPKFLKLNFGIQMKHFRCYAVLKVFAIDLFFQNDYACQNTQATMNVYWMLYMYCLT